MKCKICNGEGAIKYNNGYIRCECQREKMTKILYKKSETPERYYKRLNELKNQTVTTGKGSQLKYIELMEDLLKTPAKREALFEQEITMVLKGTAGSGKTQFGVTLMIELLNYFDLYAKELETNKAFFLDARNIGNFMFNNPERERINKLVKEANILVIDDLGAEQKNQYIFNALDEILRNFKGFKIITTNLPNPKEYYEKENKRLSSVLINGTEKDHGSKNVLYYTMKMPQGIDRRQKKIDNLNFE